MYENASIYLIRKDLILQDNTALIDSVKMVNNSNIYS